MNLGKTANLAMYLLLVALLLQRSSIPLSDQTEQVRAFTRQIEFDYTSWTIRALGNKLREFALGSADYLPAPTRKETVLEYLEVIRAIQHKEGELHRIYTDPQVLDKELASQTLRNELDALYEERYSLGSLAESVLQYQIAQVLASSRLTLGGQPLPPVLYHSTPVPMALIVSPRDEIRQENNISLAPGLTLDQQVDLEDQVSEKLDVSTLVVEIGGIGVYPTMVMQTSDLTWLVEVVAHEWVHNFLTLRPLGASYLASPELRTMNETAASIAGKELGREVVARFYPELLPPPPPTNPPASPSPGQPAEFDFRAEMHLTRVTVDRLLAEGKTEQAEDYMERRRIFLWDNGYLIRKLNQAYFAFYGAYADQPGGAAGADPVGEAVRSLREQSPSLANFLKRISWMWTYNQLRKAIDDR